MQAIAIEILRWILIAAVVANFAAMFFFHDRMIKKIRRPGESIFSLRPLFRAFGTTDSFIFIYLVFFGLFCFGGLLFVDNAIKGVGLDEFLGNMRR